MGMYPTLKLAEVPLGITCRIMKNPSLRLLELGFYQDSLVTPLYVCMHGGTRVYQVKYTLLALRTQDAADIQVKVVAQNE